MILFRLFFEFFYVGLFTFGGGLATIPFLQQMSEKTGWFTIQQLMDLIAISEATPGPISVNMATFAGYLVAGVPGGIIATIGLIAPSIIIASIVARLLRRFRESTYVDYAFYGLRPASLALIAAAGLTVLQLTLLDIGLWEQSGEILDLISIKAFALAILLFFLMNKFKIHPLFFFAGSAAIGILFL